MQSKNKKPQTAAEKQHTALVAQLDRAVCEAPGPSEVHEPEQGMWFISIPLCAACHRGSDGWHGTRKRWTLRRVSELRTEAGFQLETGTVLSHPAELWTKGLQ